MTEELKVPKSVRMTPSEWAEIEDAARVLGLEPAVFLRKAALKVLRDLAPEIEKRRQAPLL